MEELRQWLEKESLNEYVELFREHDIRFSDLAHLTEEDVREIGLPLGARRRLLTALESLGEVSRSTESPRSTAVHAADLGEAERRHLTVMFCDLVGSTTLAEELDPEDLRDVIRTFQDGCAGAITRFGGYIARYVGDGQLVYFGFPHAHEDDAERAVRAALEIVSSIGRFLEDQERRLQVRIGIASGQVVVGDIVGEGSAQEQTVVGETPNLAARLQSLAEPDSIVIGDSTRDLAGAAFEYEDLGLQTLKGISEPTPAWRVIGERAMEIRFDARSKGRLTSFIGRGQEVELLLERWERALLGEGQVVLLSGEAGIGKSRIVEAFRERIGGKPHRRIRYQCSPYHTNTPLYPAIRQLEFAAGFEGDDTSEAKLNKLEHLLAQSSTGSEARALLASLLSIPASTSCAQPAGTGDDLRRATLETLSDVFEGLAKNAPLLFVFEDLHWVDPTTEELLEFLVDRVDRLPALIIATFRPEYIPAWGDRAHCTGLTLNRLSYKQCASLIDELCNGGLPQELREAIIAKADGVPLFVEELTLSVLQAPASESSVEEVSRQLGTVEVGAIPATLQDSLLARLDSLGSGKEVAQIGAAIGREFSGALVSAVSALPPEQLGEAFAALTDAGVVHRHGTAGGTFVFKHALVQDAAYATMLRSRRQQVHDQIAGAICEIFPEQANSEPEVLAFHFTRAGQHENAAAHWLRAGRLALARSANAEAAAHLGQGLEALNNLPESQGRDSLELDLQIAIGPALIALYGYGAEETEAAYRRASELLKDIADPRRFRVLYGLCVARWQQGQLYGGLETAEEFIQATSETEDQMAVSSAERSAAMTLNVLGEFKRAKCHAMKAVASYDPVAHRDSAHQYGHDVGVAAHWHLALSYWYLGWPDRAAEEVAAANHIAVELDHSQTLAYDALWLSFFCLLSGQFEAARDAAIRQRETAEARSLSFLLGTAPMWLGAAEAVVGDPETALEQLQEGWRSQRGDGRPFRPLSLRFEGEALHRLGKPEAAKSRIEEALKVSDETGARWWAPELHRYLGDIDNDLSGWEHAVEHYRRAIEVARQQSARLLELRASTSLAHLFSEEQRFEESIGSLEPVYNGFTEGLDTPDLTNAKALLDRCR
jgi:class 3 adenylate cyclase/tetratricopeptide (TPR) repeat protein